MLAFRSNKSGAVAFTRWVASEVLPEFRKTGAYRARKRLKYEANGKSPEWLEQRKTLISTPTRSRCPQPAPDGRRGPRRLVAERRHTSERGEADHPRHAWPVTRVSQVCRLCRHRLVVMGAATSGWYELYEGDALLATFTPKQLADGIDPTTVKELSTNKRAAALMKLGEERQRLLGLA